MEYDCQVKRHFRKQWAFLKGLPIDSAHQGLPIDSAHRGLPRVSAHRVHQEWKCVSLPFTSCFGPSEYSGSDCRVQRQRLLTVPHCWNIKGLYQSGTVHLQGVLHTSFDDGTENDQSDL